MKHGLLFLFLILSLTVNCIEIAHYDTTDLTWFYIYFQYKSIVEKSDKTFQAESSFKIYIVNTAGEIIKNTVRKVAFKNEKFVFQLDDYYPIVFHSSLANGDYTLICTWNNKFVAGSSTYAYKFTIDNHKRRMTPLVAIGICGIHKFVPQTLDGYNKADSLIYIQGYSEVPDYVILDENHRIVGKSSIKYIYHNSNVVDITIFLGKDKWRRSVTLFSEAFSFQARYTMNEQLKQLSLVLDGNDYRGFSNVRLADLQEIVNQWWTENDPNPKTVFNEYRNDFYSRILYADENFSVKGLEKGWESDRGRIFILNGSPVSIDVEPSRPGGYPAIIWHYDQKKYIFFDKGYGKYELDQKWRK